MEKEVRRIVGERRTVEELVAVVVEESFPVFSDSLRADTRASRSGSEDLRQLLTVSGNLFRFNRFSNLFHVRETDFESGTESRGNPTHLKRMTLFNICLRTGLKTSSQLFLDIKLKLMIHNQQIQFHSVSRSHALKRL